jgi:iron(III) transport system substrate-binding protein
MYNNRVLTHEEVPKDWDDLLEPRWKDRIIIRSPVASGTMRVIYASLIQREIRRSGSIEAAMSWLRRLDANTKSYVADPTQLYLKIAREEGLVTLWNLPDVILQTTVNRYPFGYVIPGSGTPLIVDGIALIKRARNYGAAVEFYEFVTSVEAVTLQAKEFGRIPARRDIAAGDLPDWVSQITLTPLDVDWTLLAAQEKAWLKRWEEEVKGRGGVEGNE